MANNKKRGGTAVFIVILLIAAGIGIYTIATDSSRYDGSAGFFNNFIVRKNYIASLYIEGVIEAENKTYNHEWLIDTIRSLKDDEKNKAILLTVDSPGGGVYESDEVYLALRDYTEHTGRPVYAYMTTLAASGGYYISCAAETIYANRNTLTGSIGVIASQSVDMTELLKKLGVKVETITAGKNKNMLNINSPLTDEQRAIMQSIADEAYEQFTAIVAKSRGMKIGEVKKLADGRIYTASQAKKNGLVDEIGTWEDALSSLRKEIEDNESVVTTYRYEKKDSLLEMLSEAASKAGKTDALIPDAIRRELMLGISYPAYIYRK